MRSWIDSVSVLAMPSRAITTATAEQHVDDGQHLVDLLADGVEVLLPGLDARGAGGAGQRAHVGVGPAEVGAVGQADQHDLGPERPGGVGLPRRGGARPGRPARPSPGRSPRPWSGTVVPSAKPTSTVEPIVQPLSSAHVSETATWSVAELGDRARRRRLRSDTRSSVGGIGDGGGLGRPVERRRRRRPRALTASTPSTCPMPSTSGDGQAAAGEGGRAHDQVGVAERLGDLVVDRACAATSRRR